MKEDFTFNEASLKFLRKVIFKNFGGGGQKRAVIIIQFSRKIPCIKTSLFQLNFIKLPKKCILVLTAIRSREVFQV